MAMTVFICTLNIHCNRRKTGFGSTRVTNETKTSDSFPILTMPGWLSVGEINEPITLEYTEVNSFFDIIDDITYLQAWASWARGNGTASKRFGISPTYKSYGQPSYFNSANDDANKFAEGEGYIYDAGGDSYFRQETEAKSVNTQKGVALTDAGAKTWFAFVEVLAGEEPRWFRWNDGSASYFLTYVYGTYQLIWAVRNAATEDVITARSNVGAITPGTHLLCIWYDASALAHISIDGTELLSYSKQETYNLGNFAINGEYLQHGDADNIQPTKMYCAGEINRVLTPGEQQELTALGVDLGVRGHDYEDGELEIYSEGAFSASLTGNILTLDTVAPNTNWFLASGATLTIGGNAVSIDTQTANQITADVSSLAPGTYDDITVENADNVSQISPDSITIPGSASFSYRRGFGFGF